MPSSLLEDRRIAALHRLHLIDGPRDCLFDFVAEYASRELNCPTTFVSLVDSDDVWFKSAINMDLVSAKRDASLCHHAITGDDLFVITDLSQDERFASNPFVSSPPYLRFYAGAPIRIPDQGAIGVVCLVDTKPRSLNSTELDTLRTLSNILAGNLSDRLAAVLA